MRRGQTRRVMGWGPMRGVPADDGSPDAFFFRQFVWSDAKTAPGVFVPDIRPAPVTTAIFWHGSLPETRSLHLIQAFAFSTDNNLF
jgi:hypothetical protein